MSFERYSYTSRVDGLEDWYIMQEGPRPIGVVYLHGHGSHGDQLITRKDIAMRVGYLTKLGVTVIAPNLRDNAWMSNAAVEDLSALIMEHKSRLGLKRVVICSGSMGASGAFAFAACHPELVDGIVALGAATCLSSYMAWCDQPWQRPIIKEIHDAIRANYRDEDFAAHDACLHHDKLTMPIYYWHGNADETIPVSQGRELASLMSGVSTFHYAEIEGGNHDSPLPYFCDGLTKLLQDLGEEVPSEAMLTVRVLFKDVQPEGRVEVSYGNLGMPAVFRGVRELEVPVAEPLVGIGACQSLVTVLAGASSFSFWLRDVTSGNPIYIPEYGVAVVPEGDRRSYAEVASDVASKHLVSDYGRMEAEPEETYENACLYDRNKPAPIWLGLGRDVRIFQFCEQSTMGNTNDYQYFGKIRPRYHSRIRHALPDKPLSFYHLLFEIGPGCHCRPRFTKRLDDGVLPILHATQDEQDIQYHVTAFATLEEGPLTSDECCVRGTDWRVSYAKTGAHMLKEDELKALEPLIKAELVESPQEVVCVIHIEAENVKDTPAYAWFKSVHIGSVYGDDIGEHGWEGGMSTLNGGVAAINLVNGELVPQEELAVLVKPHSHVSFDMLLPHQPISKERAAALSRLDIPSHLAGCRAYWRSKLSAAAGISVPEAAIDERIKAGLCHLDLMTLGKTAEGPLLPTIGWYSPIGTESSPIIQFFDSIGRPDIAGRCVDFFLARQREDGFIQNFNNYQSETGPLLWDAAEHFRYSQNLEWLKGATPRLEKAADYLLAWRERNKKEEYRALGYYGLIEGKTADPDTYFHSFFLNAGTLLGLQGLAEVLQHTDKAYADALAAEVALYREDIRASMAWGLSHAPVTPLGDGTWCPMAPSWNEHRGHLALYADGGSWNSHGSFAGRGMLTGPIAFALSDLFEPHEPIMDMLVKCHQHPITRECAGLSQPYYGRADLAYIKRGEVKLFLKLFYNQMAALQDRDIYSFWEHYHNASEYKTHEEGWFLMEIRWMLWLENGDSLELFKAIPRRWLAAGKAIRLKDVRTYFGKLNVTAEGTADAITCSFSVERPVGRVRIRLPHPEGRKAVACEGGVYDASTETVTVLGGSGAVKLTF